MFRVLEFIVVDSVGFAGGFESRKAAEQYAAKFGGTVSFLPSQIVRRVSHRKNNLRIIRSK